MTQPQAAARAGVVVATVIAIDQTSKALVRSALDRGEQRALLPGLDLVHVRNDGIAFGLFSGGGVVLVLIALVALAAVSAFFFANMTTPLMWLPTGLLVGGALGNLIDRLRDGAVTDFIDLPRWPAFNFADSAITVGIVLLLYILEGPPSRRRAAAHG